MKDPGTEVAMNCLIVCCYALPFRCDSLASWQVPLTSLFQSSSNVCGAETRNKQETKKKTVQKKMRHLEHWLCCKERESCKHLHFQNPIFNYCLVR